ncbi:hypothetical protein F5Y17DRAFT_473830 [Xylariaceae sp. FL0594]|nr:hypothetical protein F5Y17DRAFT_473830 [Xylariaceae sp. FL0594]
MHSSLSALVLVLASRALAIPAPQAGAPVCTQETKYQNLAESEPYDDNAQVASGYRCTSNEAEGCTVTESATHTVTVGKSVNGGSAGSLDVTKIFSLGLDAGFTYSWSTSDAEGTSAAVTCPKGGITCGIRVIPKVVKTTGQMKTVITGFNCPGSHDDWQDFEIVAPYQIGSGGSEELRTVMDFSACLAECDGADPDACKQAASDAGLPDCPA